MLIEKNIAKHLIIGLIYPAVLGTAMYLLLELLVNHFLKGEELILLQNSLKIIFLKVVLLIVILVFYACDFLYTTYTKEFRTLYFFIDIIILIGLFTSFKATNYYSAELPRIDLILIYFLLFMLLYWCWDYFEYRLNNNVRIEKKFYGKMVKWEIISSIFLTIILIFLKVGVLNYKWSAILTTTTISISTFKFVWLVREKRDLFVSLK